MATTEAISPSDPTTACSIWLPATAPVIPTPISAARTRTYLTLKMIRIDVDHPADGKPYSIPKDNPWIDKPDFQPEAWAMGYPQSPAAGLRLQDRRPVGSAIGSRFVAEQDYLVHKGENYGWSRFEGSHPFQPLRKGPEIPIAKPMAEHSHSEMRSLTGGIVYRGSK